MKKFLKHIKDIFNNDFFNLYLFILIPSILLFIFTGYCISIYNSNYESLITKSYYSKLETQCQKNSDAIQNFSDSIKVLGSENIFYSYVAGENTVHTETDNAKIVELLANYVTSNKLIDSISIYDSITNTVYSNKGTFSGTDYFGSRYVYADYGKYYWNVFFNSSPEFVVLKPTLVNNLSSQKSILPLVFTKIGDKKLTSLMIVNIDLKQMIDISDKEKLTPHSVFSLVNKSSKYSYCYDTNLSFDMDFFNQINQHSASNFDCIINHKKNLVLTYTDETILNGYTYAAIVPYEDIRQTTSKLTLIIIVLFIVILFITMIIIFYIAKSIYNPIELLTNLSDRNYDTNSKSTNKLYLFFDKFNPFTSKNKFKSPLTSQIAKILPYMHEKNLIDFLNSNEHYTKNNLIEANFDFQYEYFCSLIIRIKPNSTFYEKFNQAEYENIRAGLKKIVYRSFSNIFSTYTLSSDTETFYVLLNLENDDCYESIDKIINDFKDSLSYDSELISVKIAEGGIYSGISGLKKSHEEAIDNISRLPDFIHINKNSGKTSANFLNKTEEDKLYCLLMLEKTDDFSEYLTETVTNMITQHASDKEQLQFYIQVFNILIKVMRNKKIEYDLEDKGDMVLLSELMKLSISEIHEFIILKVKELSENKNQNTTKISIENIVDYIGKNYAQELSLDFLANQYSTTPKYLSKIFKDKLGINFVDYIASVRIEASKKLLIETDKSIMDILSETGFNNRNTFIRTFKKITGLSPSDYRREEK